MHPQRAVTHDIPAIVALERTPFARELPGQWTEEHHRSTLRGSDARYLVAESDFGQLRA